MSNTFDLLGAGGPTSPAEGHPNPYYNYSQIYSPKRLKELFKWCEYLFYNSAHIYSALRKFGEYPITEVIYETTNKALKDKHKNLLERVIRARELLIKATLDKYVYGNAFISMYQPFIRYLKCTKCQTLTNVQNINYKFSVRQVSFSYTCPACKADVTASREGIIDRKLMLSRKVNFIRWDPKLMDIDHNPMTGDSVYYWTIPQDLMQGVNSGHKTLIDTLPLGVLQAIKEGKKFKFAQDAIFHMKIGGPAGISPQWGLPPLISTLQLFHYTAILRKANECVSPEALIETPEGLIRADDVRVGNLVRGCSGAWCSVTDKNYRPAREEEVGIRVTIAGMRGLGQVYSPKHPILTLQHLNPDNKQQIREASGSTYGKHYGQGKRPPGKILEYPHLYEETYCPAEQLSVGDYALYPRMLPVEPQIVDVAKYTGLAATDNYVYGMCCQETAEAFEKVENGEGVEHNTSGKTAKRIFKQDNTPKRFPAKIPMTSDLAYILGWYAGDGSCNKSSVIFSLGTDDNAWPLCQAIKRVFDLPVHSNMNTEGNLNTITICNVVIRKLIKGMISGGAREKRAPIEILNGPNDVKLAYLKGLWEADGYLRENRGVLATSSLNQAYDVYRLLLHLGCIANIRSLWNPISLIVKGEDYRLIRNGRHYPVSINGPSKERLAALWEGKEDIPEVKTGKSGFIWKNYYAVRVCKLEEVREDTYIDFKVAKEETFSVAGICSHNSIALDFLTPYRILHPAQASGNADPVVQISLAKWKDEMSDHIKQWRRDPLHIMFSPIPIGMVQVGGQGRALLTLGEVQEAEKNIVAALGIPMEFLYGGLTKGGMEATLRLIENQLETHVNDLKDLLQWADDKCAQFLGWEKIPVSLTKFRMVDDYERQGTLFQIWSQGKQTGTEIVSDQTLEQTLDLDHKREQDQIKQEKLDTIRRQQEMEIEIRKLQDNMATRVQLEAQQGPQSYNQQQIIAQADDIVQQFLNLDPGTRRSKLHQLQVEDLVMYSVVIQRLEQQQTSENQQAVAQNRGGA
jgi:hypothetical protein